MDNRDGTMLALDVGSLNLTAHILTNW
jgi:hypothetical protein